MTNTVKMILAQSHFKAFLELEFELTFYLFDQNSMLT